MEWIFGRGEFDENVTRFMIMTFRFNFELKLPIISNNQFHFQYTISYRECRICRRQHIVYGPKNKFTLFGFDHSHSFCRHNSSPSGFTNPHSVSCANNKRIRILKQQSSTNVFHSRRLNDLYIYFLKYARSYTQKPHSNSTNKGDMAFVREKEIKR